MTKLQVLNVYFTERLMAAAQEILQVVEETLMEYQEESDRAKRENESLRRRLREAGLNEEAGRTKSPQSAPPLSLSPESAPLLSADRTVSEQQEWSSREQDPDSPLTAVKLEFTEPQRNRREEEEDHRQEEELHCRLGLGTGVSAIPSPFSKRDCDQNSLIQPTFPSPCGKRDGNLKLQFGNAEEDEPAPSATHYQVKTETDGVSYSPSDQPAEPLPFHVGHFEAAALPSRTDMSVSRQPGGQMSEFEAQLSPGTLERLRGQSTHFCPQCGKAFRHRSQVRRHMRMHTGEKPFCCPVCEKCFKYSGNLKEHQIVHTGEKPHRCSVCGRCFGKLAHLQRHLRIHTGEKPYRCPVCERCFTQSGVMKRHLQVHNSFNYS